MANGQGDMNSPTQPFGRNRNFNPNDERARRLGNESNDAAEVTDEFDDLDDEEEEEGEVSF